MSSTSNLQNVLANVIRPVYIYDPATSNYAAKVIVSNVDTFSVRTIEVENLEFGDANRNLYLGVDAGSTNSNSASNVAIGYGAAENNINTKNSVFLGYTAGGENITDASATVAVGANTRSGGSSNVYVGYGTGSDSNTATGNVFLGPNLTMASAVSNQVRIGAGTTVPFSADMNTGYVGINTSNPAYALDVVGTTTNLRGGLRVSGGATLESGQPSAVELGNGDSATGAQNRSVLSLQYWIGGYRHMVRSRHDASANSAGNAIDLFVNNSDTATGSSQPGTGNVLALSATAVGVGIGTSNPTSALDVSGTVRASGFISTGGATSFGNVVLSSGGVQLLDGSSANPTLTFQNDLSLGLYRAGSNSLGITTAGLERVRIDSNGRIGVGLSNPNYSIDVSGIVRATGFIGTSGSGSSGGVVFNSGAVGLADGSVSVPTLTFQNDLSLGLYRSGSNDLRFVSAGINRMTMSNGNFGIATTAPAFTLDVSGTTQSCNAIVTGFLRNALAPTQFDISGGNISNSGTHTASNFIGTTTASNQIGGVTLSNTNISNSGTTTSANLIASGYLRNALAPTQFDISGGNISNSGVHTTTGLVGTYLRNALAPTQFDISGGNISNSGTTTSANLIASGYLRNALGPTQFDLSGGNLFLSNRILTGAGTVSAPSHTFANDASMGLYDPATNVLGVVTAGVERMRVLSNGNVGIATTNPAYTLDVSGTTQSSNVILSGYLRDVSAGITFDISGGTMFLSNRILAGSGTFSAPSYSFSAEPGTGIWRAGASNLAFMTGGGTRMWISNSNVGIGTSTPFARLAIDGTDSKSAILFTNSMDTGITRAVTGGLVANEIAGLAGTVSDTGSLRVSAGGGTNATSKTYIDMYGGSLNNFMALGTTGTQRVTIDASGSVGIGMTTPSSNLNVNGTGLVVAGNMRMGTSAASYRQFSLGGGNSSGFLYGAFNKYGDGIHIGYNFYNDNSSNVIPNSIGQTARLQIGYGTFGLYTGAANTEPTNVGYYQTSNGTVGIRTTAPVTTAGLALDVSGGIRIVRDGSSSLTSFGMNNGTDTLILQHTGDYDTVSHLGRSASLLFANAKPNYPQARIVSEMTSVTTATYSANLIFQTNNGGTNLAERMRINSDGRVGIATAAPAYQLDVSEGPTVASVNMSTWPRQSQSNVMIVRGASAIVGNSVNWSNVQQNTINTNLMTVVLSNITGCSFKVLKSGVWSFNWTLSVANGFATWLDASTNDNSNIAAYTAGNPVVAYATTNVNNAAQASWTGYLPSNTGTFYKIRSSGGAISTPTNWYLQATFLYEMPASGSTFPF